MHVGCQTLLQGPQKCRQVLRVLRRDVEVGHGALREDRLRVLEISIHVLHRVRDVARDEAPGRHVLEWRPEDSGRPFHSGHLVAGITAILFDQELASPRIACRRDLWDSDFLPFARGDEQQDQNETFHGAEDTTPSSLSAFEEPEGGRRKAFEAQRLQARRIMSGGQVLVVDDEPAIRALVARIVERSGLGVDTAKDGAEAIEKLRERPYEVVVLDMMMPRVDGAGVIAFLSHSPQRPTVIVVSAGDPVALRKLDPGVVHSIVRKPFDIDTLGDLVIAAVRSRESSSREDDELGTVVEFPRMPNG